MCDLVREGLFSLGEEVQGAASARAKYRVEALERRRIFEEMLTMKGRIRVMARVRPGGADDGCLTVGQGGDTLCVDIDHNGIHKFRFDEVSSEAVASADE